MEQYFPFSLSSLLLAHNWTKHGMHICPIPNGRKNHPVEKNKAIGSGEKALSLFITVPGSLHRLDISSGKGGFPSNPGCKVEKEKQNATCSL